MTTTEVKTLEGISSETAQALTDRAAAAGLSPDDYLKSLLGLTNGTAYGAQPNVQGAADLFPTRRGFTPSGSV